MSVSPQSRRRRSTATIVRSLEDSLAHAAALGAGEIVCHGDIGPHNTVYRAGLPVAFIDWDTIGPNDPMVEFAIATWKYVPLGELD